MWKWHDTAKGQRTENKSEPALDLSKEDKQVETRKKIAEKNTQAKADPDLEGNLDSVIMSGQLSEKLKKETKAGGWWQ